MPLNFQSISVLFLGLSVLGCKTDPVIGSWRGSKQNLAFSSDGTLRSLEAAAISQANATQCEDAGHLQAMRGHCVGLVRALCRPCARLVRALCGAPVAPRSLKGPRSSKRPLPLCGALCAPCALHLSGSMSKSRGRGSAPDWIERQAEETHTHTQRNKQTHTHTHKHTRTHTHTRRPAHKK